MKLMLLSRQMLNVAAMLFCSSAAGQATYDARILEYTGLSYPCQGEGVPVLKILNAGSATMGTCVVETWKNGLMVNSFNWILAVPALPGQVRQPSLPSLPLDPGDQLEFHIISVNEEPDEDPDGNVLVVAMDVLPVEAETYSVHVAGSAGNAPDELTWVITAANGQMVAQGGPYAPQEVIDVWVELLPEQCYMVRFAEAGSEPSGEGQLSLSADGAELVVMSPGTAAEPSLAGLISGIVLSDDQRSASTGILLSPNPTEGPVRIYWSNGAEPKNAVIRDAAGRVVFYRSIQAGSMIDLSGQAPGAYSIELMGPEGRAAPVRVMLQP
ncbi:MAG TPA: T9SS type A sorting domain-containing protein [Flavobacteriales bacterium]|nr:T9SS type A sorting domain-containing protein [Flavobacteriales bacterium]